MKLKRFLRVGSAFIQVPFNSAQMGGQGTSLVLSNYLLGTELDLVPRNDSDIPTEFKPSSTQHSQEISHRNPADRSKERQDK